MLHMERNNNDSLGIMDSTIEISDVEKFPSQFTIFTER